MFLWLQLAIKTSDRSISWQLDSWLQSTRTSFRDPSIVNCGIGRGICFELHQVKIDSLIDRMTQDEWKHNRWWKPDQKPKTETPVEKIMQVMRKMRFKSLCNTQALINQYKMLISLFPIITLNSVHHIASAYAHPDSWVSQMKTTAITQVDRGNWFSHS